MYYYKCGTCIIIKVVHVLLRVEYNEQSGDIRLKLILLVVTICKHIVTKYINSHLNHIPIKPSNVPMKSLNVWNEEIFHDVKVLGEYTTTAAMKEDIQRDIDHLYALLDQCTH